MRVKGDEKLLKALGKFSGKLSGQVLRRAGQKAATPLARRARQLVKPVSKTIAKSIATKVKVYKSGKLFVAVGPRAAPSRSVKENENPVTGEKKKVVHDARYTAHLVERGTKAHKIVVHKDKPKIVVNHPGTKAHLYLERARIQEDGMSRQIYINELRNGIEKLARELNTDK